MYKLFKYSEITKELYEEYIGEWEESGEQIVPMASSRNPQGFDETLLRWQREERDEISIEGKVPATLYFYGNKDRIIGAIHLRHELNGYLLNHGGHIGYGIRKSERGRGHSKKMLKILLDKLWSGGYEKVLITCDDDNIGSRKVIESASGLFEDIREENGTPVRRYWIKKPS